MRIKRTGILQKETRKGFPQFTLTLREIRKGEFTIVSFSRISPGSVGEMSTLRCKQVLIPKP